MHKATTYTRTQCHFWSYQLTLRILNCHSLQLFILQWSSNLLSCWTFGISFKPYMQCSVKRLLQCFALNNTLWVLFLSHEPPSSNSGILHLQVFNERTRSFSCFWSASVKMQRRDWKQNTLIKKKGTYSKNTARSFCGTWSEDKWTMLQERMTGTERGLNTEAGDCWQDAGG